MYNHIALIALLLLASSKAFASYIYADAPPSLFLLVIGLLCVIKVRRSINGEKQEVS